MSYNKSAPVPAQEKCIYTSLGGNKLISAAVYSWKICTAAAPGVVHSSSQSLQITGNTTLRKTQKGYVIFALWLAKKSRTLKRLIPKKHFDLKFSLLV